jgi:hypothetical protein
VLTDPAPDTAALDDPAAAGLVVWPLAGLELRPFDGGELDAEEAGVDGLTLGRVYLGAVLLGLAVMLGGEDVGADAVGVGLAHVAVGTVLLPCATLRLAVSDGVVVAVFVAVPVSVGVTVGVSVGVTVGVSVGVTVGVVVGVTVGVAVPVGVPPLLVPPDGLVAEPAGVTLGVADLVDLACTE